MTDRPALQLAIFGASGTIGGEIAKEALNRGHHVLAVARDPSRIDVEHAGLDKATGDVTDTALVAKVAAEADVVVSAVGGVAYGHPDVVVDAARSLLEGARGTRVFVVGGAGSLIHPAGGTVSSRPDFPELWKPGSHAQTRALEVFRSAPADADWTYLSPAHEIAPGPRTGAYRVGGDDLVVDESGHSRISIADYAVAVLDELEQPRHRRVRFTVAY